MKFIDEVKISVTSGHGGPGAVSFRREKYIEYGGPDGGNGGRGGDVRFLADENIATLLDLRMKRMYVAGNGEKGSGRTSTGHDGKDIILKVPVGTILLDEETNEVIHDFLVHGEEFVVARGGRGGKGNDFFRTSTNQAPQYAQPGEEGVTREIRLELKLLADVGLLGLPNAGKSSLISRMSAARPKVADYPFTTLVPNLGVVAGPEFKSFVMADIPGLIEGAHLGQGLGIKFLKHLERCKVLVHVLDVSDPARDKDDPLYNFSLINNELHEFSEDLLHRPMLVFLNKVDSVSDRSILLPIMKDLENQGYQVIIGSCITGEGTQELKEALYPYIWPALSDAEMALVRVPLPSEIRVS